jgi:hypothetical protein
MKKVDRTSNVMVDLGNNVISIGSTVMGIDNLLQMIFKLYYLYLEKFGADDREERV